MSNPALASAGTHVQVSAPRVTRLVWRDAFARAQPAAMALRAGELIAVNIDVPTAVAKTLGKLRAIVAFRERVVRELPSFEVGAFDELETYVLATAHAHALYLAAAAPRDVIAELTAEGKALLELLRSDARALAKRELIPGDRIKAFGAVVGFKNLAFDLLALAALLRRHWDAIAGKTAVAAAELERAETIGSALLEAVGQREHAPTASMQAAAQRQRAFTLFVRAYGQVRRALGYFLGAERLETVAPSLYAGRARRRSRQVAGKDAPPQPLNGLDEQTRGDRSPLPTALSLAPTSALGSIYAPRMQPEPEIIHEEANGRGAFYIERDGKRIAEQAYRRLDEHRVVIVHTEVDASLRGQGIARRLLDTFVAWARSTATRVKATCPYAKAQFEKDASIQDVYEA